MKCHSSKISTSRATWIQNSSSVGAWCRVSCSSMALKKNKGEQISVFLLLFFPSLPVSYIMFSLQLSISKWQFLGVVVQITMCGTKQIIPHVKYNICRRVRILNPLSFYKPWIFIIYLNKYLKFLIYGAPN